MTYYKLYYEFIAFASTKSSLFLVNIKQLKTHQGNMMSIIITPFVFT